MMRRFLLCVFSLVVVLHCNSVSVAANGKLIPTPFGPETQHYKSSSLRALEEEGVSLVTPHVLTLRGSPTDRGYSHGFLAATQIRDWIHFFLIDTYFGADVSKYTSFLHFCHSHMLWPEEYETELNAMLEGMETSGADISLPSLGRNVNVSDLYALNAYLEGRGADQPGPFNRPAPSSSTTSNVKHTDVPPPLCTQAVLWGHHMVDTGELIHARNMDGECDDARVTVTHLLVMVVHGVDSKGAAEIPFASVTWPGFVGVMSAINVYGSAVQINCGSTGPGPVVKGLVPISYLMRQSVATLKPDKFNPKDLEQWMLGNFASAGGGVSGQGSILVFSNYASKNSPLGFVYECDRFGGVMRLPGQAPVAVDCGDHCIAASNHNHVYGVSDGDPHENWGVDVSFSSLWRYEAITALLDSRGRVGKPFDTEQHCNTTRTAPLDLQTILQRPAHGATEHSVMFLPNRGKMYLAVAAVNSTKWDAPYLTWLPFSLPDLFDDHD